MAGETLLDISDIFQQVISVYLGNFPSRATALGLCGIHLLPQTWGEQGWPGCNKGKPLGTIYT